MGARPTDYYKSDKQKPRGDGGVEDKRRLVIDGELASTLKVMGRQGNTLSSVLRKAWDDGNLMTLTKHSPARATDAHVSIIGHITREELKRHLTATEQANGFANRFLWICAARSKSLPDGGRLSDSELASVVDDLQTVITFAQTQVQEMRRDETATELWHSVYARLSAGTAGLVGAVIARAEAQVTRLSCLYALLDGSDTVRVEHLQAALAVWKYCEDSARHIFGDSIGDWVADRILRELRASDEGLTRTQIGDLFQRNQQEDRITAALDTLERAGVAERRREQHGAGRPVERWCAT